MATQVPLKKSGKSELRPQGMLAEMEQWAEGFFPQNLFKPLHLERPLLREAIPQVDLIDKDDKIIVRAAVPGFTKDNLEVSATDNTVTIRGSSSEEQEETGEYYRHEIHTADFMRTVRLPSYVDDEQAKATFKKGMLEIVLPKVENAKRHTLEISG
ncbi:MAG: hypothetical protein BMS9Abin36_1945 [Gammaproteobacteria bacterium]|nr:MAG: hypothetical protein BMS9Abin36_1945 [Gammaproteobacteria bacterium]